MKRLFLVAGETSGDIHGSLLARELLRRDPELEIWGVGGDRMEAAGVRLLLRSEELAVVGFVEVLTVLPRVIAALSRIERFLAEVRPDLFIPIDFPDFNFRLLRPAYRLEIPIVYYISPQVWAWRRGRIDDLRRFVRRMIVIFPFEEELYREHRVPVTWVGHPLLDELPPDRETWRRELRQRHELSGGGPIVALLPGSRRSEVRRIAPLLGETRRRMDEAWDGPPIQWIVGQAPHLTDALLEPLGDLGPTPRPSGFEAMGMADLVLVASGTATLEALLLNTPAIVVYKIKRLTYEIAKRLIRVDHIAMANLVADRKLVPEFIQDEADPNAVAARALSLLGNPTEMSEVQEGMADARRRLGEPGAAGRAADVVLELMGER